MIDGRRFIKSFKYAFEGIHYAFKNDQNLLIHLLVAFLVINLSIALHVVPYQMAILGLTMMMVITAEMINSAIEKMVDLITKEHRQEAKIAKDVAAGMVLVTAIAAAIIGTLIFLPYIMKFLH
ncbi:MAG TPA: diacylglycerol kinase family protein [Candidatus Sulfotelmatobacter sp.]|jgi:diacylglycerol kinase|nr:diacylglycerol kinase family protein [Candidatus Sulfotelmatobacter sp.]